MFRSRDLKYNVMIDTPNDMPSDLKKSIKSLMFRRKNNKKHYFVSVIKNFSKFCLWFWCELNSLINFFTFMFSESFSSSFWILKADESVASGWVVFIDWNLAWDNFTEFWKILLKCFGIFIFWNFSDEYVLLSKSGHVWTKELVWVWEGTTWFTFKLKVAQRFYNIWKLVLVFNLDYCSVERFVWITTNLWLMLKLIIALIGDNLCEGGWGE